LCNLVHITTAPLVVSCNPLCTLCQTCKGRTENLSLVEKVTTIACQVDCANATKVVVVAQGNTNEWPTRFAQEIV
jgi:hypothetical protein